MLSSILDSKTRLRIGAIGSSVMIIATVWVLQLAVVSQLLLNGVQCSLPLTLTIVWGIVFGSPLQAPSRDEIRLSNLRTVVLRQVLSGSISGALVGACLGALFSSVLYAGPAEAAVSVYPISYPIIGWMAGYFCLRNFNQALILCIPLVLIFTFLSEALMALQLLILGRPGVIDNFLRIVMTEAVQNALIAPFIFLPMRGWAEFARYRENQVSA
jgi:hypothetical protein